MSAFIELKGIHFDFHHFKRKSVMSRNLSTFKQKLKSLVANSLTIVNLNSHNVSRTHYVSRGRKEMKNKNKKTWLTIGYMGFVVGFMFFSQQWEFVYRIVCIIALMLGYHILYKKLDNEG